MLSPRTCPDSCQGNNTLPPSPPTQNPYIPQARAQPEAHEHAMNKTPPDRHTAQQQQLLWKPGRRFTWEPRCSGAATTGVFPTFRFASLLLHIRMERLHPTARCRQRAHRTFVLLCFSNGWEEWKGACSEEAAGQVWGSSHFISSSRAHSQSGTEETLRRLYPCTHIENMPRRLGQPIQLR